MKIKEVEGTILDLSRENEYTETKKHTQQSLTTREENFMNKRARQRVDHLSGCLGNEWNGNSVPNRTGCDVPARVLGFVSFQTSERTPTKTTLRWNCKQGGSTSSNKTKIHT